MMANKGWTNNVRRPVEGFSKRSVITLYNGNDGLTLGVLG